MAWLLPPILDGETVLDSHVREWEKFYVSTRGLKLTSCKNAKKTKKFFEFGHYHESY